MNRLVPREFQGVEPNILPLVKVLNQKGYLTYSSCEGHHRVLSWDRIQNGKFMEFYESVFSLPWVRFLMCEHYRRRLSQDDLNPLAECLETYTEMEIGLPWTLKPSGWANQKTDDLRVDLPGVTFSNPEWKGETGYHLLYGEYEGLIQIHREVMKLTDYLRRHLASRI